MKIHPYDLATDQLSRRHVRLLARAARSGLVSVTTAADALGFSRSRRAILLATLVRRGWLKRLRRGLYLLLPLEAESQSSGVAEDAWVLADEVFSPCYIGGWTAAEHWGLTEQIFRSTFVVSTANVRRTSHSISGSEFRVVKSSPNRVDGIGAVWRGRERIKVSSRERTIVDALITPGWLGGVRHLADVLLAYRNGDDWRPQRLLSELEPLGTGAAFKRLGFLAETLGLVEAGLTEAARSRMTAGIVKLDPSIRSRGRLNKHRGLWINASVAGPQVSK